METLFRWIHLSDIHVGHGDKSHGWDQELVMDVLRKDIAAQVQKEHAPIDAILVTGDIAFSGAGRSADEYDRARKWFDDVAVAANVDRRRIFVVPGNHDVNRGADKDRNTKRLLDDLRSGRDNIDNALHNGGDRALLEGRMKAYLAFAADFAPACKASGTAAQLYWVDRLFPTDTLLKVRLVGMNTALLAADNDDKGKLQLGKEQLRGALMDPAIDERELVIVLSHHPFVDGWLADQREIDSWVRKYTHVHLSGHVHEADTEAARKGWGDVFVRVVAGTVHGDQGAPAGHGYSFGGVVCDDEGKTKIRISPRRWAPKRAEFILDVENVPDGERYAEHELRLKLPVRAAARPDPATVPTVPIAAKTPTVPIAVASGVAPVEVFISACPGDWDLSAELEKHLALMKRQRIIRITSARTLGEGQDARTKIKEGFAAAKLILLLLSVDYFDWEFCEEDLGMARERKEAGGATVIPIVLKPVPLEDPRSKEAGKEWFAGLVRLPRDGRPVTMWPNRDQILTQIATDLKQLIAAAGSRS
jgi:hypothetical protein